MSLKIAYIFVAVKFSLKTNEIKSKTDLLLATGIIENVDGVGNLF